jgi:hypothetical protein
MNRITHFITSEAIKSKGEVVALLILSLLFAGFLSLYSARNDPTLILKALTSLVYHICLTYVYFFISEESLRGFKLNLYEKRKEKNSLQRMIGDDGLVLKKCKQTNFTLFSPLSEIFLK